MPCPLPHALASPCLLRCVSPSPSHRLSDGPSFFPLFVSPVGSGHRLALPFPCHLIEYAVRLRLLACRCRGWGGRCLLISSSRHLVSSCGAALRFLLACGSSRLCRLISLSSSSRSSLRSSPPRSSTRLGGAWDGERRCPACLVLSCGLCRCLPVSIAGSFRFHPLRCHLSVCLLCRLGCVSDSVLISSC